MDFRRNNPDWYDVNRPSRLPSFPGEFGDNGHFYLSPRQSRFGAKGVLPTSEGDVTATFDFDMFGVGRDAGLTTIRLRNAWGQWKQVGGGLRDSQFMDGDVFPNILEVLGSGWDALLPEHTGVLGAVQRWHVERTGRDREPGRKR